jgi:hypothetical protein
VGASSIQHGIYYRSNHIIGSGAARSYIVGNLIAFNAGRGISMHDNSGGAQFNLTVAHNTIAGCGQEGALIEHWEGSGSFICNNLLHMNRQNSNGRAMRYNNGRGVSMFNNIRYSSTAAKQGLQDAATAGFSSADYSDVGNQDTTDPLLNSLSLSGTPGRNSSDSGNLHLLTGSVAIGLGLQTYSVSPDYDAIARGNQFDAGAYEFV